MVKKHLPVTKLVARNANKMRAAVQPLFIGWHQARLRAAFARELRGLALTGPSLAAPASGRYKPPHPATRHMW
jgi:predicted RNase H-like nuclease